MGGRRCRSLRGWWVGREGRGGRDRGDDAIDQVIGKGGNLAAPRGGGAGVWLYMMLCYHSSLLVQMHS